MNGEVYVMKFEPELMTMKNGKKVETPEDWKLRREEIVDILCAEEYGYMPKVYGKTVYSAEPVGDTQCAGHATTEKITATFPTEKGDFTFSFHLTVPTSEGKHPLFVIMNFGEYIYGKYIPLEEIVDNGFAVAKIYYQDITSDDGDMTNGLAGMYTRPDDGTGYGKISLWAFAMSRALDCIIDRPEIDSTKVAAIGHSRLGKTALWCGANDERFTYVISNDSGCGGAAYERTKHENAETIAFMNVTFPFWFCENRQKYAGHEGEMPFDQHFLVAASAPRNVLVGSANLDLWADPYSEQLSCVGAAPAFELSGRECDIPDVPAKIGDDFGAGDVAYHLREGKHYLGRADWQSYMKYISRQY